MLELSYPIEPDEHGVIDGIRLATAMMRSAVDVLLPYVRHCPGCLDAAFNKLASELLETMHEELKSGQENALLFTPALTGAERHAAIAAHMTEQAGAILELLTPGSNADHCHLH